MRHSEEQDGDKAIVRYIPDSQARNVESGGFQSARYVVILLHCQSNQIKVGSNLSLVQE
jgi:hypothetical protein